jgi:hypothetical protein
VAKAPTVQPTPLARLRGQWREIVALAAAALLLGALAWRLGPPALHGWRAARARRAGSEASAFRRLRIAIRAGEPAALRGSLAHWAATAMPGGTCMSLSRLADAHGATALAGQMTVLDRALYAEVVPGAPGWSRAALERSVGEARELLLRSGRERIQSAQALAPLNPQDTQ